MSECAVLACDWIQRRQAESDSSLFKNVSYLYLEPQEILSLLSVFIHHVNVPLLITINVKYKECYYKSK